MSTMMIQTLSLRYITVIIVCQLYLDGGNNIYAIIIVNVYTKRDKDNIRINNNYGFHILM